MAGIFKRITKGTLVIINLMISAPMFALYFLPKLSPSAQPVFNLLPLAFPYLLLLQMFFVVIWLFVNRKLILIPIVSLLICWKLIFSLLGSGNSDNNINSSVTQLSIASWNVQLFGFFNNGAEPDPNMLSYAKNLAIDVLCVQELVFSLDDSSSFSLERLKRKLGYRYAFAGNYRSFGVHAINPLTAQKEYYPFCLAIFSNYPIVNQKKIRSIPEYNHTFIWTDIKIGADTIRVFNIHLQSMHFVKKDYDFIETIDQQSADDLSSNGKSLLRKLRDANFQRAVQVLAVRDEVQKSPYPVILCGDLNDVPNSYAYQVLRKDLRDGFSDKGFGIGRTFQFLAPTLRVDYIFYSDSLPIQRFRVDKGFQSDHKPLVAVFDLPAAKD
jgi:endonuclease/exonuclease/phosphatase family metal-dependent hydrolase